MCLIIRKSIKNMLKSYLIVLNVMIVCITDGSTNGSSQVSSRSSLLTSSNQFSNSSTANTNSGIMTDFEAIVNISGSTQTYFGLNFEQRKSVVTIMSTFFISLSALILLALIIYSFMCEKSFDPTKHKK